MKRTITCFLALLLGLLPLSAQQFTNAFEILVKEGAKEVSFMIMSKSKVLVDWGDGTQETVTPIRFKAVKHEYAEPLAKLTTVTLEGSEITEFRNDRSESGSIVGVGNVSAPLLESFVFFSSKGATMAQSKEGVVDLSNCPKLKEINIRNAPSIKLGDHPRLKDIKLSSSLPSSTDGSYAELSNKEIDLSLYPELSSVYVVGQKKVQTINLTGLSKLTSFKWNSGALCNATGLKDLTKNALLSDLNISGHSLPLAQLPDKNPAVSYTTFNIQYDRATYKFPEAKLQGATLDLSDMLTEYDFNGTAHHGTMKLLEGGYSNKEIAAECFSEENGVFTFDKSILGDKDEVSLKVVFTPAYFTAEQLTGSATKQLQTATFKLTKDNFANKITFKTGAEIGSKIAFLLEADGEVTAEGLNPSTIVVGGDKPTEYTLTAQDVVLKGDITGLMIPEGGISEINVSGMPSLASIDIKENSIQKFDFSKNNALESIILNSCYSSEITLPEEGGTLTDLDLRYNSFKSINLAPYTELNSCDLSDNDLQTVDVSANEELEYLYVGGNRLKSIDVSHNTMLSELVTDNNEITALDVTALEDLTYLSCKYNSLKTLDISKNPSLKYLLVSNNEEINEINLASCPGLKEVDLAYLDLKTLDLKGNPEIKVLNVSGTKIATLDLSKQEALEVLNASYTPIEAFDFTTNTALKDIDVANTKITALPFSNLKDLVELSIFSNNIKPQEMTRIIDALPTVSAKDENDKPLQGRLIIQHAKENEALAAKGMKPIEVFKSAVAKAKEKNWGIKVLSPGFLGIGIEYKDYGEGIEETATERILADKWHIIANGKMMTIVGAEGNNYSLYSLNGTLLKQGAIHSSYEKVALGSMANGTYIVVINGKAQRFTL